MRGRRKPAESRNGHNLDPERYNVGGQRGARYAPTRVQFRWPELLSDRCGRLMEQHVELVERVRRRVLRLHPRGHG